MKLKFTYHSLGEDFDNNLLTYFVEEFKQKHGKDITTNPKALKKLKLKCTEAKHALSQALKVDNKNNFYPIQIKPIIIGNS